MTQDDFATALEQELQLQGRAFSRADLLEFAASVWPLAQENPDVTFWAREFIEAERIGMTAGRRRVNGKHLSFPE